MPNDCTVVQLGVSDDSKHLSCEVSHLVFGSMIAVTRTRRIHSDNPIAFVEARKLRCDEIPPVTLCGMPMYQQQTRFLFFRIVVPYVVMDVRAADLYIVRNSGRSYSLAKPRWRVGVHNVIDGIDSRSLRNQASLSQQDRGTSSLRPGTGTPDIILGPVCRWR